MGLKTCDWVCFLTFHSDMEFVCLVMGFQSLHVQKYVRVSFASLCSVMGNHLEQFKIFRSFPTSGLVMNGVCPNFKTIEQNVTPIIPYSFVMAGVFFFYKNEQRCLCRTRTGLGIETMCFVT